MVSVDELHDVGGEAGAVNFLLPLIYAKDYRCDEGEKADTASDFDTDAEGDFVALAEAWFPFVGCARG